MEEDWSSDEGDILSDEDDILSPLNQVLDTQDIKERVLLFLPVSDLLSQCSSSQENRKICSSRHFWLEKFNREGLSLLEKGQSVQEWVAIYTNSLLARDVSNLYLGRSWSFPLSAVQDINLLLVGGITREELSPYYFSNRLWRTKDYLQDQIPLISNRRERRKWREVYDGIKNRASYTATLDVPSSRFLISHRQRIDITPDEEGYDFDDLSNNYYIENRNVVDVTLSTPDLKELLYRLVYFNVDLK
ncbi:Hypothetical protein BQ3484_263 [Cedratvirus A11]|uniref:F-box domain n=1 Tax=Cedratvirus A11 TaxID=1903266 RepID=A0A1M7XUH8_9VIRU|nr:Hypothetical protein BQ3484_263 [Cedratvirus A11]SHO33331.1 Hypothetical protein BQ3484_263 [Cedratvirus A11]